RALSKTIDTSARPRLLRAVEPLKMTSAISPPRRLLADCSPSTQRTASTTLDLPLPLGPTTAVTPGGNSKTVLSAKLLKPTSSRRLSMAVPEELNHKDSKVTKEEHRDDRRTRRYSSLRSSGSVTAVWRSSG